MEFLLRFVYIAKLWEIFFLKFFIGKFRFPPILWALVPTNGVHFWPHAYSDEDHKIAEWMQKKKRKKLEWRLHKPKSKFLKKLKRWQNLDFLRVKWHISGVWQDTKKYIPFSCIELNFRHSLSTTRMPYLAIWMRYAWFCMSRHDKISISPVFCK